MLMEACWTEHGGTIFTCFGFDIQVIPGQDGRAVEALCWVDQRLFSAGLNGEITEYDLENLRPRYTVEAYGGPIWTISSSHQGTLLAVSEDSFVIMIVFVLFSVSNKLIKHSAVTS